MVSSPMYERLKVFMQAARSNRDLDAWESDHQQTIKGLEESVERLKQYRDSQGFVGETADAMNAWVDKAVARINGYKAHYQVSHETYEVGRRAMEAALKEAELLSPTLLDADTAAMRDNPVVMVPSSSPGGGISVLSKRFTTGAAYVDAVEAQANAQREAAATRILTQVNAMTGALSMSMRTLSSIADAQQKQDLEYGADARKATKAVDDWANGASTSFDRSAGRNPSSGTYPGGFAQPWWSEADAAAARNRTVASGAIPTQEPAYGELGSRTNPITDPQELMGTDLLHTPANGTAYRNGVLDGHTPAPPADAHHPLWRLNGGAASDSATAGRLGGAGVLGAGALGLRGAARMGSGSFGGSGSLGGSSVFGRFGGAGAGANGLGGSGSASGLSGAGRMGAAGMRGVTGSTNGLGASGAAGLKVGSYSGSGFGSYTPPAGSAGAAGAGGANGAAGSSGVTGTTGANGGSAAGAAAAGKGGSTGGGFMGAGAGAGAGAGKEDKKGRKNRYVAFKFDDDEDELPAGYVNPLSQTSGTDKDIAPAKRTDDGWDPRQW
ncbi:hypothetical protein [Schaalia sp. ORNL0103]|uniref:hypothetical protein n=1 Tax=Schaalia sp. ORNL0103 TaxID=2789426 RepID=UPI001CA52B7C|nr:hypothetical protein [Schaalia sp. ORNL0103]MBW6413439.1 hypothetical protein [Schaalia sp. ORNL0103]